MTMPRPQPLARVLRLSILAGLLACPPAIARDAGARDLGDWTVARSGDGQGCFLTRLYDRPGETTLLLGLDRDGTNHLTVLNANWSIEPRQKLKLDFRLSKGGYAGHFAVGMASDGKRGFVTSFETQFPAYFASSHMLAIARGDVPVERLPLDGSGAGVAALRQCVAKLGDAPRAASGEKGGSQDIPRDPFATGLPRKSRG
ncbi:hypothetical protein [Sphingomonas sp.]|uniref:hypothetical protein n=1 Tax=Sphingomonas sp. TaxID=28214 RepID=UPI0028A0B509|nr:hypothetical protein [Sphingomonas sp.]